MRVTFFMNTLGKLRMVTSPQSQGWHTKYINLSESQNDSYNSQLLDLIEFNNFYNNWKS